MNHADYIYVTIQDIRRFLTFLFLSFALLILSLSPFELSVAQGDTAQFIEFHYGTDDGINTGLWATVYAVSPGPLEYQSCEQISGNCPSFPTISPAPPYNGNIPQFMGPMNPNTWYRITVRPSTSATWTWTGGCLSDGAGTGCVETWFEPGSGYPFWGRCGDGVCRTGEAASLMCSTDCGNTCGNGLQEQPAEQCDPPDGLACSLMCTTIVCGDGKIEGTEQCEPPGSATCDNQCRRIVSSVTPQQVTPQPFTPPPCCLTLMPTPTLIPIPSPTVPATPPPIDKCELTPKSGRVNVRPNSSTSGESIEIIEMGRIIQIEGETIGADNNIWFEVSVDGKTGWVSSTVVNFNNECEEPLIDIFDLLTASGCDAIIRDVEKLRSYVQQAVALENLSGDVCDAFNNILKPPSRPRPLIEIMTNLKYLKEQCPAEIPNLLDTLQELKDLSENTPGQDTVALLQSINDSLTQEDACLIAGMLNDGQLSPILPASVLSPLAIAICTVGITPERYAKNLEKIEQMGATIGDLTHSGVCNWVKDLNAIGRLDDNHLGLYNWIKMCSPDYTVETALRLVRFAIMVGADKFLSWTSEELDCKNILNIISDHQGENLAEVPLEFAQCNAGLMQLFLKTYDITEAQIELFLDSDEPCLDISNYLNSGEFPEPTSVSPQTPIPPVVIIPPSSKPPWTEIPGVVQPVFTGPTTIPNLPDVSNDPESTKHYLNLLVPPTDERYLKASAVIVHQDSQGNSSLGLLLDGETQLLTKTTVNGRILSPILYRDVTTSNLFIAYLVEDQIGNIDLLITTPEGEPSQLIPHEEELRFDPTSRIAWARSANAIIATLVNASGQFDLYEIGIGGLSTEPIIMDAHNPAVSSNGLVVTYERGDAELGQKIYVSNFPSWQEYPQPLNPPNESYCFAPVFDVDSLGVFFTCSDDNRNTLYFMSPLGSVSIVGGNPPENSLSLAPGPILGLVAFDDEQGVLGAEFALGSVQIDDQYALLNSETGKVSQIFWRIGD